MKSNVQDTGYGTRAEVVGTSRCLAQQIRKEEIHAKSREKVSRPGQYSGYSAILYSEIVRTSQYVPGFDGTG
jgi:hypothetical protein